MTTQIKRDPETGRFVSVEDSGTGDRDMRTVSAVSEYVIPAGDLGGADTDHGVVEDADFTEFINWSDVLGVDEIAELIHGELYAVCFAQTTATAESYVSWQWALSSESELTPTVGDLVASAADVQQGVYDRTNDVSDLESIDQPLHNAIMTAEAGHSDTTNGLAAGAMYQDFHTEVHYPRDFGESPVYDVDDELFVPVRAATGNVSDHNVNLYLAYNAKVQVHEMD